MSPWISEGSLLEQGVRTNSSLRLKTGIQELQHKAWSGLLHPSSILFSYHGAHQEADLQLCYVGACLPVWLLGKETKKQKLKKKKSFESFGKKKKVLKAKLTADRSSHSSEGASPMPHTADSWKLMWAPVSHQLMQLSAWHTCTCVDY